MKASRNSQHRRKPARRKPRIKFYIFAEGKNTEKDYLKCLEAKLGLRGPLVEYFGALGVPKTVATEAIKFARNQSLADNTGRRRRKLDSYEENDEVWAVFDRDEHPAFKEAIQNCRDAGVSFAYSDPCFELWLLLHLISYDAPCDRGSAQRDLKIKLDKYDPKSGKTADFEPLVEHLETAESRAEHQRNDRRKEGNEDGNPSTNVYELTRKMKHAVSLAAGD